jgi:hypothetical protein
MMTKAERLERAAAFDQRANVQRPYQSDKVTVEFLSDLSPADAERLIGLRIVHVDAGEYVLTLGLSDGRILEIEGARWDGCSLGVELSEPQEGI